MVSICEFHAGNARNVIPQTAELRGTVRTLTEKVRELVEKRVREIVAGVAQMTGARIDLVYERGYPVTVNHAAQTDFAMQVAREIAGDSNVRDMPPMMGAEDFSYMLEARPGAFIFCGNGDTAGLHHPAYNFNDDAIVYGTSYWIKLVENNWRREAFVLSNEKVRAGGAAFCYFGFFRHGRAPSRPSTSCLTSGSDVDARHKAGHDVFLVTQKIFENTRYKHPDRIIAAGSVSTQASAMLRMVDHCSPEPFAAIVPAMPDDSTWVVETGRP